jgi:hypothetical protein
MAHRQSQVRTNTGSGGSPYIHGNQKPDFDGRRTQSSFPLKASAPLGVHVINVTSHTVIQDDGRASREDQYVASAMVQAAAHDRGDCVDENTMQ